MFTMCKAVLNACCDITTMRCHWTEQWRHDEVGRRLYYQTEPILSIFFERDLINGNSSFYSHILTRWETREYRWLMLLSWQRTDRFGDKSQRRDATADRSAPWWWWWWFLQNWLAMSCFSFWKAFVKCPSLPVNGIFDDVVSDGIST